MKKKGENEKKIVSINPDAVLPETLKRKIEEHGNTGIYLYEGPTCGCITRGIAITFPQEPNIFFEAPRSAVSW